MFQCRLNWEILKRVMEMKSYLDGYKKNEISGCHIQEKGNVSVI